MMKKQQINNNKVKGPTCGNCIHNPSGRRCSIYPDWAVLPDDPAATCEYHFFHVPKKQYLKYHKKHPCFTKGWPPEDTKRFIEHIKHLQHGIVFDGNGGYFIHWPFLNKIIP